MTVPGALRNVQSKSISSLHQAFNSASLSSCRAVERKLNKWQASTGCQCFDCHFFNKKWGDSHLSYFVNLCSSSQWETYFFRLSGTFSSIAVELNLFHLGPNFVVFAAVVHRIHSPVEMESQIKYWNLISNLYKYSLTVVLCCLAMITYKWLQVISQYFDSHMKISYLLLLVVLLLSETHN